MELVNEVTPAKRGDAAARGRALRARDGCVAAVPVRAARVVRRLPPADRTTASGSSRGRPQIPTSSRRDTFELVCQVNGKVRDRLLAPAAAGEDELIKLALAAPNVLAHVDGKQVVKTIVVPGRLVNLVVR